MARHICPNRFSGEGNNGGSFVTIDETGTDGVVRLRVGCHCVITVDQDISVVALAQILTTAKDEGFEGMMKRGFSAFEYHEGIPNWALPF
jgi:hypothetical protein